MSDRANPFEWSGGHPGLDFVNTLDERPSDSPVENLTTYRDLVQFVRLAGLVEPPLADRMLRLDGRACSHIATRARKLREHLHDVLVAAHCGRPVREADLKAISTAIQKAHTARVLGASNSSQLASHCWCPPLARDIPLHACSLAIERLLLDENPRRIRQCDAADCEVYFVDTSKGHLRQWCSMKGCGNREKQRRWRSAPK